MVLVDTSIWSLALRRANIGSSYEVQELQQLISDSRVVLIEPIRQELLSGIRYQSHYDRLRNRLRPFPDKPLVTSDYELAAEFFNTCRANGVQGSNIDFLICAVASKYNYSIFTNDQDFFLFQAYLPISLHPTATG